MRMRTVVAKFGGTSLASAGQFRKIREIVEGDPSRRFVVASAPGKRFDGDTKVTDLLLDCYDAATSGRDFEPALREVGEQKGVIVHCQSDEIFKQMHRI